jgi:PPM family protein phosphatase
LSRRESPFHLEIAGATHIGRKPTNENHYRYDEALGLLAVASGVSRRPSARVAADAAIEALFDYVTDPTVTSPAEPRERMERALAHVHRRMRERAAADDRLLGMAATLACVLEKGRLLLVGHAGDSRVIRIREGRLERLTAVHHRSQDPLVPRRLSLATESDGRDGGTQAIGLGESLAPDVCVEGLRANDGVLVCTDGLTAVLDDRTILQAVQRHRQPHRIVNELVEQALAQGARDSITLVYGYWRAPGS